MRLHLALLVAAGLLAIATAPAFANDVDPVAPQILEPPELVTNPSIGQPLESTAPVVADAHADDIFLHWERARFAGSFEVIAGAHEAIYVPQPEDLDARLRVCATVETAGGEDAACSPASAPVADGRVPESRLRLGRVVGLERVEHAIGGGSVRADVDLARWVVRTGDRVRLRGTLSGETIERVTMRLEPTVPGAARWAAEAEAIVTTDGRVEATVRAGANSIVILQLFSEAHAGPIEVRVGVLGVRPRITLRLGARPAGRDAAGRRLIRDLRLLPGSVVAPHAPGLRLRWEGILPGQRRATSVCRRDEGVVARVDGALRGRCSATGAWSSARWRLVYDPGTDDPGATAWLPATSAWKRPRASTGGSQACATLPAWNSPRCSA